MGIQTTMGPRPRLRVARVIPYSWELKLLLSNFEIRLDDATRPRQDPAVTVAFDLFSENGAPTSTKSLHGLQHLGRFEQSCPCCSA